MVLEQIVDELNTAAKKTILALCGFGDKLVYEPQLDREIRVMRQFFNSPDGFVALINFFIRAETQIVDEPAGVLDVKEKKFVFHEPSQKKVEQFNSVLSNKPDSIDELIGEVKARIKTKENYFLESFLDALEKYKKDKNEHIRVLFYLKDYLRTYCLIPERSDEEIEVHIHPHTAFAGIKNKDVICDENPGYSDADKKVSSARSLGLIEYTKSVEFKGESSRLMVTFDVFHRIACLEKRVGHYLIAAGQENTLCENSKGRRRMIKTPKITMSRFDALYTFIESPYMAPLIAYDKNEDLVKGVYKGISDDIISKNMNEWLRVTDEIERVAKKYYHSIWKKLL